MEIGQGAGARAVAMRYLIVKFSSIGDCVMTLPFVKAIRDQVPRAFLAWAVDPRCRPVIHEPLLDEMIDIPWEVWKRDRVSSLSQLRYYLQMRRFQFDVGIDLQGHAKTAICLRFSGAKRRLHVRSHDPLCARLSTRVPTLGAVHTVERNLEALPVLGLLIPARAEFAMPAVPAVEASDRLATIAVGTGHPSKNYARWAEVARQLLDAGFEVAFLGGPGEMAPDAPAKNLVGQISLRETMGWVAASRVHIAADTGTGHMAAALGVPVVSVFGPTSPDVFRPYTDQGIVLDAGPEMTKISPDEIVAAARKISRI